MFDRIGTWLKSQFTQPMTDEEFAAQRADLLQKTPVPVTWLFGKTGSGKSSVVKFLTGAEEVGIGSGFKPETMQSARYDFPSADHPVLQFLDTRGLGEAAYDPTDDIEQFDPAAHLMLVTARVMDNALDSLLRPLRAIRRVNATRPILLVLTCLHEAYPQKQHPDPDPFAESDIPDSLPDPLKVALRNQHNRFEGLADRIVPVDLTGPDDGFDVPDFGGDRLKDAFIELLPEVYRQTFLALDDVMGSLKDLHEKRAMPYVMSAASMSASAASVPIPWIDLPVVAGIQSDMIRRLGRIYNQPLDLQQFLKMAGAVGGPMLIRHFFRETLKVVPGVGSAANAALAFASTYALGKACCWYFGEVLAGVAPTAADLRTKMAREMDIAKTLWKKHKPTETAG